MIGGMESMLLSDIRVLTFKKKIIMLIAYVLMARYFCCL